jgi:hypothetical protein
MDAGGNRNQNKKIVQANVQDRAWTETGKKMAPTAKQMHPIQRGTGGKKPARKTKPFWTGPKNGGYEDEYPAFPGARFPLSDVPRTDSVRSRAYTTRSKAKAPTGIMGGIKKVSDAVGLTDNKNTDWAQIARTKRLKGKGG